MRIERHAFGSYSGYATLARSPGVTPHEVRHLEASSFAFGQTSDRGYLKGLKRSPAYFTRALPGGRRGLTRVLEGSPDDNDRPTLLMLTAILPQRDWDNELCGDIGLLLNDADLWEWAGGDLPALERVYPLPAKGLPRKSVPKVLALVSELERRLPARQPVIVSPDDFSLEELRTLEVIIPPSARPAFTSACRSLSAKLPVSVNCLAAEADSQAVTFRPSADAPPSPYARFLASTTFASGALPLVEVMQYRTFGRPEAAAVAAAPATLAEAAAEPPRVRVVTRTSKALIAILLLLALLMAGGGFFAGAALAKARAAKAVSSSQRATTAPTTAPAAPAAVELVNPAPPTPNPAASERRPANTRPRTKPSEPSGATGAASPTGTADVVEKLNTVKEELRTTKDELDRVKKELDEAKRSPTNQGDPEGLKAQLRAQEITDARISLARAAAERLLALLGETKKEDHITDAAPLLDLIHASLDDVAKLKDTNPDAQWLAEHKEALSQLADAADCLKKLKALSAKLTSRVNERRPPKPIEKQEGYAAFRAELDEFNLQLKKLPDRAPPLSDKNLVERKNEYNRKQSDYERFASRLQQTEAHPSPSTKAITTLPDGTKNAADADAQSAIKKPSK